MPSASDPYHAYNSAMPSYGPTHSGYGAPSPSYGANMIYNPFQQWQRPPAQQQRSLNFQYGLPSAMITNAPSTSGSSAASTTWFPDSGASFHVTGDARNIQEPLSFDGPEQIFIGNGQGLDIHSAGSSVFSSPIKPQITLTLDHLLHVPSITKNLISVSQFAKDNSVFFEFYADHCVVKSQATKEILLHGKVGSDGLYTFPSVSLQSAKSSLSLPITNNAFVCNINSSSSSCNNQSSFTSQYLWHLRLGHPNIHTLKLALQHCNIPIINKEKDVFNFCTACCMGKAHRLHSPSSETTYTHPLQLVFSDLWGPSPTVSSLGYKYYITFVDAFSRYTWIYLLKAKSEAEYRSLAQATADILWVQTLLQELTVPFTSPTIFCDNQSAVLLAHNPILHSRTMHMEIDLFFVREKVLAKQLSVVHIPGTDQWADVLTEPLSTAKFLLMRTKLNVEETPH